MQAHQLTLDGVHVDCACAADVDEDGKDELVVGALEKRAQPGVESTQYFRVPMVFAYDPTSSAKIWQTDLPEQVQYVQQLDSDSDYPGRLKATFWTGEYSILDADTGAIIVEDAATPFALAIHRDSIDLDGDGADENVIVTSTEYHQSTLSAYDEDEAFLWSVDTPGGAQGGFRGLRCGNLDGDGAIELVMVTGDYTAYGYDGMTGELDFTMEIGDYGFLELLDANADGRLDVVATRLCAGDTYGVCIAAYNGSGPDMLWQSGALEHQIANMTMGDYDADGSAEIMLCHSENGGIQFRSITDGAVERVIEGVGGIGFIEDLDGDGSRELLTTIWEYSAETYYSATSLKAYDLASLALEWDSGAVQNVGWTTPIVAKDANGTFAGACVRMQGAPYERCYVFAGSGYPTEYIEMYSDSGAAVVIGDADGDQTDDVMMVSAGAVDWSDAQDMQETFDDTYPPWYDNDHSIEEESELVPVVIVGLAAAITIVSIIVAVLVWRRPRG
jgi:hypothetical protein